MRRRLALVPLLALGAVTLVATGASASSSPSPLLANSTTSVTIVSYPPATKSAGVTPSSAGVGSGAIYCQATVDNVHKSTTPGANSRPNVHARISCTGGYPSAIGVSVGIYLNGGMVGGPNGSTVYGKNVNESTADGPAISGSWRGGIGGYVTFPPGYTPQSADLAAVGATTVLQYGACGGSVAANPASTTQTAVGDARRPQSMTPMC